MERIHVKINETKEHILKATMEEFMEKDYNDASMRKIASKVGTISRFFKKVGENSWVSKYVLVYKLIIRGG